MSTLTRIETPLQNKKTSSETISVEQVLIEIAHIGFLNGDDQEQVILEFAGANPNTLGGERGGLDKAKALGRKAFGSNASSTLDNVQQSIEALPFGFLKKVDPQNVMTFINDEHPQTIALIVSHLPPEYGAKIISELPEDRQLQVIRR